jgi:hypothetical protein
MTEYKQLLRPNYYKEIIGKIALIGLTYYKLKQPVERRQLYGKVRTANKHGIIVELLGSHNGEKFTLPPGIDAFVYAEPGYYRFRSSEGGVENPDFVVTYNIYRDEVTFKASRANQDNNK